MRRRKLTPIFLEGLFKEGERKKFFKSRDSDFFDNSEFPSNLSRYAHFKYLIILAGILILTRLFFLTVIEGKKYREYAENNRIRYVLQEAPRGKIFDRDGTLLADSATLYFLDNGTISVEVTKEQVSELEGEGLAGIDFSGQLGRIKPETVRVYPLGEEIAHVLGFVSRVQPEDFDKDSDLSSLDFVGRLGVEETYDEVLRGQNGARIVEVDASGKVISILGARDAVSGQDIKLTLDLDLQKIAFTALSAQIKKVEAQAGAVIISDIETGGILALVSFPSFDPDNVGQAVVDNKKPLFNRVVSGTYAPGSVFKPISAIAGLESGKIDKDTEIEDVGEFSIGEFKFGNWYFLNYGGKDGILKIDRAIARSNDIFFYRLGERVGLGALRDAAIKMGFGKKTGVDLPGESFGLVPDEVWKRSAFGDSWFLGDTMHFAIGQGFLSTTPLQVNVMTATIANGGKIAKPHLVLGVKRNNQEEILVSQASSEVVVDDSILSIIREGMLKACERGGTAWPFFDTPYKVGCKTGTAEKVQGNPHAWFTTFAPYDNPEIAITTIIEEGGEGSSVAAPVAREILDWWFKNR